MSGSPIRIWRWLGVVDWWWLLIAGAFQAYVEHLLGNPRWFISPLDYWYIAQAAWLKAAEPDSRAIWVYSAAIVLGLSATFTDASHFRIGIGLSLAAAIVWMVALFLYRDEFSDHFQSVDPRGVELNPFMTFFFSTLYMQYWIRQVYREQTEPELRII